MSSTLPRDILIGARGWNHADWQDTFFPDDLPEDWRLPYYANEFNTVLVPEDEWINSDITDIEQWLDDTGEEFIFYFETQFNTFFSDTGKEKLAQLNRFKDQLGGLLITGVIDSPADVMQQLSNNLSISCPINIDFYRSQLDISTQHDIIKNLHADPCWQASMLSDNPAIMFKHHNLGIIDTSKALSHKEIKNFLDQFGSQINNKYRTALFLTGETPHINNLRDTKVIKELIIG